MPTIGMTAHVECRRRAVASSLLRDARTGARMTQEQLAHLAGLHVRSIRGIESGKTQCPRRDTLARIAGALSLSEAERAKFLANWSINDVAVPSEQVIFGRAADDEVLDALARDSIASQGLLALSESVEIGQNRRILSRRTEEVIEARRTGVTGRTVFYEPEDPSIDLNRLKLVDLENCRIGREIALPSRGVKVFELDYERTLDWGDSHLFRYRADFDSAYRETSYDGSVAEDSIAGFFRPPLSLVLEIKFSPEMLPATCTQVFQSRPAVPATTVRELHVDEWSAAHIALANPRAGAHGIAWQW